MGYLTIAKYAGIGLVAAFLTWCVIDRFALATTVHHEKRCVAATKTPDKPVTDCDAAIADRVTVARHADACEAALQRADRFAAVASCGEQVKRLQASADATAAEVVDLTQQLASAGADRDAAVQRAEARAIITADRDAKNAHILQAAPRQPDGRVHCDADCLRAIAGD